MQKSGRDLNVYIIPSRVHIVLMSLITFEAKKCKRAVSERDAFLQNTLFIPKWNYSKKSEDLLDSATE